MSISGGENSGKGVARAKGKRVPPSKEYEILSCGHAGAVEGENGVFRLADYPLPEGVGDEKIHYRIVKERDHSSLVSKVYATVGSLEEIVVECTHCPTRVNSSGKTVRHRIISVHAKGEGPHRLVAIRRRDEQKDAEGDDGSSLGAVVLRTFLERAKMQGVDVSGVSLIGLDPELADPEDRLLLSDGGISYALRIEPNHIFSHVRWQLSRAPDALEPLGAETIIGLQWPDRAPGVPSLPVPILDLSKQAGGTRKRIQEHLLEVPVPGEDPDFFLVGGPVSANAQGITEVKVVQGLAQEAAARAREPLADDLRMREFDYPDDEGFCTVLIAVDYGRGL